jgi:hypothetical protein
MKSCPTCNRTFEDTLTYCLVDGSILSAPFDSQATIRIPEVRRTNPPPTEVLPSRHIPYNAELPPTLKVSHSAYSPNVSSSPSTIPEQKPLRTFVKRMLRGAMVGVVVGMPIGIFLSIVVAGHPSDWAVGLFFGGIYGTLIGAVINSVGRLLIRYIGRIWKD